MTMKRCFPPSTAVVVLAQFAATAFMTGVIWYVQIVHYPLMAGWPHDQFAVWEERHREMTGPVVLPMMLLEGLTAALLFMVPPRGVSRWLIGVGGLLLAGIWASTFLLQIPCHDLLSQGWDGRVHTRLVQTNWLRTVLWTVRLGLAVAMVVPLLTGEDPQPLHRE
jgi:hypothetical protein